MTDDPPWSRVPHSAHWDFFLTGGRLSLGVLDRHPRPLQTGANGAHDLFFLGRLEDVVILVVAARELQVAIAALAGRSEALVEQEEFQLGRHEGREAHVFQPLDLLFQDGARRVRHFFVSMMVQHIAQHQRVPSSHGIFRSVARSGFMV